MWQTLRGVLVPASASEYGPLPQSSTEDNISPPKTSWRKDRYMLAACSIVTLLAVATIFYFVQSPAEVETTGLRSSSWPRRISKAEYIDALVQNPVVGRIDTVPIRQKCDGINYQEGLIWHCGIIVGGIGNVLSMLLNCVRYAMEAGG